ncbi:MAG: HDOD domain-containing protein [Phycisphaerae bacterium]|nr:HDOD domain-containing protein [Phycisphaerae bacterium]
MIRVLFVDDEPKVLRGLERMLASDDCDWETAFAEGGRAALKLLAERPFDAVITDMRMPEMDGAALLNEVMQLYPHVVRIVLSGHSERELILRSINATHRYLAKPCEANDLRNVVTRAVALRRILTDPSLQTLVSQLNRIPSMPRIYRDLTARIQCPSASLKDLGAIVAQDLGMTAKILQIVNSAYFGLPRHVSDPVQAVCLLGLDVLNALVMTIHIFAELAPSSVDALGLENLWTHSTRTGALAKKVASLEQAESHVCDHAFMAGLLHDIGKLILAANQPDGYREALWLSERQALTPLVAERQVFGATHAEVGAYLLGLWGLPDPTVEAVSFHHRPEDCKATTFTPLVAVHVADALERLHIGGDNDASPNRPNLAYLERLGLAKRWPVWCEHCLAGESQ